MLTCGTHTSLLISYTLPQSSMGTIEGRASAFIRRWPRPWLGRLALGTMTYVNVEASFPKHRLA